MENIKRFIYSNKANITFLFIWLFITVFTMFHHEIWRDEAQAWCICRDLSIIDIWKTIRIEGHPIVWYLILFPFAKLGFPVEVMQIVSLVFVLFAVIFVIFKSPFNHFEKFMICFSAGMLYYLPIISRSYAITPVLLFLILNLYSKRREHPFLYCTLIIILSQTHNYLLGFAGILFALFFFETIKEKNKSNIYPILITIINFMYIFFMFYGVQDSNYTFDETLQGKISLLNIFPFVGKVFLFDILNFFNVSANTINLLSFLFFVIPIFTLPILIYKQNKKISLIYLSSISFMFLVYSKVYLYGILYQKVFLIYLIILFCYWLLKLENKNTKLITIFFGILFIGSSVVSLSVIPKEIKFNFSGSKQISDYIKTNLKNQNVIVALGNPYVYSAISAYLPNIKLYNSISESYISYFPYEKNIHKKTAEFPEEAKYFIIQNKDIDIRKVGFNVLYETNKENLSSKVEKEIFTLCTE